MKDHFTLEQKVGQLFVLGFQGYELDRETRMLIETIQPGGFLLFQRNIENFDQIYNLTSRLRDMAGTPGLLAIDHEGGRVDRLKQLFAPIPSMAELAEAGMASLRLGARIIAAELEATGFNVDFAPVVTFACRIRSSRIDASPAVLWRLPGSPRHSSKSSQSAAL